MNGPSDADAYSYAKFLVDIFPEDAIDILCERGSRDIIKLVEQQVDRSCIKLGGGSLGGVPVSRNQIKGMVQDCRWDELNALRESLSQSATTTPRDHRRAGQGPPTPSSTASGSPHLRRNPSSEWIVVHGMEGEFRLTARSSGSEEYLIGRDKLERFQGLILKRARPPKKVALGGQMIDVAEYVCLTWNRPGDGATDYKPFWVVPQGLIRLADVLLGYRKEHAWSRQDKGSSLSIPLLLFPFFLGGLISTATNQKLVAASSPLSLEPQAYIPPPAPTPPQLKPYLASTSKSIHSIHDSPSQGFAKAPSHKDVATGSRIPLRTAERTATMNSGPPSVFHLAQSTQPSITKEREPSRPGSASSTRTTKSSQQDTVPVRLLLHGTGKQRALSLDLTMNGDKIIPFLEPHFYKLSGGQELDRSIHEITIIPLKENTSASLGFALNEDPFDYIWGDMVEFMRENRARTATTGPQFQLDIG
jgi:hypothetical protein